MSSPKKHITNDRTQAERLANKINETSKREGESEKKTNRNNNKSFFLNKKNNNNVWLDGSFRFASLGFFVLSRNTNSHTHAHTPNQQTPAYLHLFIALHTTNPVPSHHCAFVMRRNIIKFMFSHCEILVFNSLSARLIERKKKNKRMKLALFSVLYTHNQNKYWLDSIQCTFYSAQKHKKNI